ncbi:MAG TPA: hypothetical protein VGU20_00070 [Stellaceae bacterium]|nr:hypothetical protein [Stellaceae bacterium]
MTIDPVRGARRRRYGLGGRAVGAGLLLSLLALAACTDTINFARDGRSINVRDCVEWRTESVSGCYDGQGGGGKN